EMAEHPFILEFQLRSSDQQQITSHRWLRDHRKLTLLLNVLLSGRMSVQPRDSEHFWAAVSFGSDNPDVRWVQRFYHCNYGEAVTNDFSPPSPRLLPVVDPADYHSRVDQIGSGLHIPGDLDELICLYRALAFPDREKFDRVTYWMDIASGIWGTS